jgi:putative ABC transport system permease protein
MVCEEMAIAQQLKVGDTIQLTWAGLDRPVSLPITGIVNMSQAEALFATATEAENAIVANVVFVDSGWFITQMQPQLEPLVSSPPASLPVGSILLDQQAHVRIDRSQLPADPTRAALFTAALRRELERQFPGRLKASDNLSAAFRNARADVLSAKILFIFLGLPGVALAACTLAVFVPSLIRACTRRSPAVVSDSAFSVAVL